MRRRRRRDRLASQQTSAQTGGVLAESSGDDPGFPLPDEKLSKPAAQWFQQDLAGAGESAADDDQLRCQQRGVGGQSSGQGIDGLVPDDPDAVVSAGRAEGPFGEPPRPYVMTKAHRPSAALGDELADRQIAPPDVLAVE